MKFETGTTATLTASFFSSGVIPATLDEAPDISFYLPDDTPALEDADAVITNTAPGVWEAVFGVPENVDSGWYKAVWHGLLDGEDIYGIENFQIVEYGSILPLTTERSLRRRLNDKLDDESDDSDAFFTDDEILGLLAMGGGDIFQAALDGWAIKMAWFSDSVDINESGSERKGSQLFRQAQMMAKFYSDGIKERSAAQTAAQPLPVAVVASLRRDRATSIPYNPFTLNTDGPHCRLFPLKRFMDSYYLAVSEGWAS